MKPDKDLATVAHEEVEVEPSELFVGVGILVIEGRTPAIGPRGYGEGPHCAPFTSTSSTAKTHVCNTHDWQCVQQENFRKHMLLLWQNNIPMSIEVLLCPDCCQVTENRVQVQAGDAAAASATAAANLESNCILLEQWTVTMSPKKSAEDLIPTRALLQAVRSYLHFSQLSAWYSLTCGKMPRNIVYRVCVPGEVFSNKFNQTPTVHAFPLANVGWSNSLNVCVKALPRSSPLPPVTCKIHTASSSTANTSKPDEPGASCCALSDNQHVQKPSLLMGDGLLDPPQLLEKFPKRYQSPSRGTSPASVETPEHWMFGSRGRPTTPSDRGRPWRRSEYSSPPGRKGLGCSSSPGQEPSDKCVSPLPSTSSTSPTSGLWCPKAQRRDYETSVDLLRGKMTPPNMTPEETMEILQTMRPRTSSGSKYGDSSGKSPWGFPVKTSRLADDGPSGWGDPNQEIKVVETVSAEEYGPQCKQRKAGTDKGLKYRIFNEESPMDFVWKQRDSRDGFTKHRDCDYVGGPLSENEDCLNANGGGQNGDIVDISSAMVEGNNNNNNWSWAATQQNNADIVSGAFDLSKVLNRETSLLMTLFKKTAIQNEEHVAPVEASVVQKKEIPTADDKAKFRRSLDSATNMVFHNKTGLPLTSSPAPLRKGTRFDFDSSLTSVAAIRHALFEQDQEMEEEDERLYRQLSASAPPYITHNNLLGNFEESVLNGRLEPVSTVQGFTAEIGASGTFCPKHQTLPVTVFFYSLSEVDKLSTPYMGHINLGKVGYHIPKKGTIQVTLFNPHGTVVKMFVVVYDLSDMPPRCQTFLRQRTLYMPVGASPDDLESQKWLRYLIHLRIASSKSGRIYLHTDIRMVIFRKSDMDAATVHGKGTYELRSFTKGPVNPKFSPKR